MVNDTNRGPVPARPTLAVWKFASCDGCQLSVLDCEDELLTLTGRLTLAVFAEATSTVVDGPYDLSLVEGSISTPSHLERIRRIRERSRRLVTIGACATAGGIQALRNTTEIADVAAVYPEPSYIATLDTSSPISDHVRVDAELRGCPIDRRDLIELLTAILDDRPARIFASPVCTECKRRGLPCVVVAAGTPCLGPVTHAGCGALCPSVGRGCYGCFGPAADARADALHESMITTGHDPDDLRRLWAGFSGWSPEFRSHAGLTPQPEGAGDRATSGHEEAAGGGTTSTGSSGGAPASAAPARPVADDGARP